MIRDPSGDTKAYDVFTGSNCIVLATPRRNVDGDEDGDTWLGVVVAVVLVGREDGGSDVVDGVGPLVNPSVGLATAPACRCGCDEPQPVARTRTAVDNRAAVRRTGVVSF